MLSRLLQKLLFMLLSLFLIVSTTFILMKSIPGDPFSEELAEVPTAVVAALRNHYGLDDPLYKQYFHYLYSVATWNLGPSFKYEGRSVNEIIADGFPISASLGVQALVIAVTAGIFLGSLAALKQNQWQDYTAMIIAAIGISVPGFILATFLQYFFGFQLGLFPIARFGTVTQSILPSLALAALPTAFIARLTRANMLEVLQQDYIKTARSKGLSEPTVILKHALRNSLLPIISYLGQIVSNILLGSFVIEKIFGIPGLGQWLVNSVTNRDYTVIMGITVFYAALLLTTTFLVDLAYTVIDPRIKDQK